MASKRPTNPKRRSTKKTATVKSDVAKSEPVAKDKAEKLDKVKGPSLPEIVAGIEERLLEVENRLGIDHAAIAADRQASTDAGIAAAPLSEVPAEDEEA